MRVRPKYLTLQLVRNHHDFHGLHDRNNLMLWGHVNSGLNNNNDDDDEFIFVIGCIYKCINIKASQTPFLYLFSFLLTKAINLILNILLFYRSHAIPILVIITPPNLQDIIIAAGNQHSCYNIPLDVPNWDAYVMLQADDLLENGFLMRDGYLIMMQEPNKSSFSRTACYHVKASPIERSPSNIIHRLLVLKLLGIKIR